MGSQDTSAEHTLEAVLEVFETVEPAGTPLTASEVGDELGCARRTAYGKLEQLADDEELNTKKVGARGRVWWRPVERPPAVESEPERTFASEQFDELVDAVADYAIFVLDEDGVVQTWNEGARQIKGYEVDEIVGEHFSRFYTEDDREAGRPEGNLEVAREEGRVEDEGWRLRRDGSRFWANVTITSIHDDDGELRGFVKVTRDMTDRHAHEERLRERKERFEALVREVKDYAIFLLDEDGRVETWNDGARQLKGYEEDEIVGEHFSRFYTEDDREAGRPEENLRTAAEEGRVEDEGLRVRKDGDTFWANVVVTALYDGGEVRGYAKVTRDMTERHEYEQRLRHQRDELDELDQINEVIRDIDQTLVTATSREEIEQAVCDRLATSDAYSAAWTAEYAEGHERLSPRAWAGVSEDFLDAIRDAEASGEREPESGVGATALRTQTVQPVQELRTDHACEPWREASVEEGFESAITVPLVHEDVEYGVLTVYAQHESAFDERKIEVLGELGETISHAIAAIRRKERERTLTALQASTRELLHAESHEAIGDVIVDTLTEDLALSDALVYHFDTTENVLEPVSSSFHAEAYTNQLAALSAGAESPVWASFVEGELRVADEVLPSRTTGGRRTLLVPLGDHGVLAVATAAGESVDENTRQLVRLVAATAEAAFDRVESQANLRERDELLQTQNQRLQRLNGINTIIREVDQGLVQATTREEIQRVVCDRLTESDRFRFTWIGTRDDLDDRLTPQAWSGEDRGYLDDVDFAAVDGSEDPEPAVASAQSGEITVVSNVAANLRGGSWRKEAFSREFQSAIAVPLTYGDVTYGVLTVYAARPEVFEEMERSVFAELGQTIANAINAVDTRRALLSNRVIELQFRLGDESTSFLARLAREVGCDLDFEGAIPISTDRTRLFFVATGATEEELRDVLGRSVVVESHELVAAREEGFLVEAIVAGPTVPGSLAEEGASLRSLSVTDAGVDVVVDLPSTADVREFIERFQRSFETAEFVARRARERSVGASEGLFAELEDSLTDRQLEVLETAFYSGYFASPRESTGGDVAELLDVSQPTVTEQLRAAQYKVLDLLLDELPPDA